MRLRKPEEPGPKVFCLTVGYCVTKSYNSMFVHTCWAEDVLPRLDILRQDSPWLYTSRLTMEDPLHSTTRRVKNHIPTLFTIMMQQYTKVYFARKPEQFFIYCIHWLLQTGPFSERANSRRPLEAWRHTVQVWRHTKGFRKTRDDSSKFIIGKVVSENDDGDHMRWWIQTNPEDMAIHAWRNGEMKSWREKRGSLRSGGWYDFSTRQSANSL